MTDATSLTGPDQEATTLGRALIEAMRVRRGSMLSGILRSIDGSVIKTGNFGSSRHQLARKQAAEQELINRAREAWKAFRQACEATALPHSDALSSALKGELRQQVMLDRRSIEAAIAPKPAAAAFGGDRLSMDLGDASERALAEVEPEIDLFVMALRKGVASGYAYSVEPRATAMAMPQKTAGVPLIFISYSHDSDEHKAWVRRLAEELVSNGVDAILDQWHLKHGRDLALFMERGIVSADYVLMICTEGYVTKANERAGGVGYESLFLTSELLSKVDSEKLIPIVRQSSQPRLRPAFVTSRLFADLSDEVTFSADLEDLLRTLHNAPRHQPPSRGESPFVRGTAITVNAPVPRTSTAPIGSLSTLPIETYELGKRTIAAGGIPAWNQLREKALVVSRQGLFNWRQTSARTLPSDANAVKAWTIELIDSHASVIALSVAAALSGTDRVLDQAPVIDRVINPEEWDGSGLTAIVEAPCSIGWAIHLLSGAALCYIGRLDAAFSMARSRVHVGGSRQLVVESHALTGWPPTLGNSELAWDLITRLREHWPWLDTVFGDKHSVRAVLTTHQLALNIAEFAERLSRGQDFSKREDSTGLWVPLWFIREDERIQQRAYQFVTSQGAALATLLNKHSVGTANAAREWTHWLALCARAGASTHRHGEIHRLDRYADLVSTALAG